MEAQIPSHGHYLINKLTARASDLTVHAHKCPAWQISPIRVINMPLILRHLCVQSTSDPCRLFSRRIWYTRSSRIAERGRETEGRRSSRIEISGIARAKSYLDWFVHFLAVADPDDRHRLEAKVERTSAIEMRSTIKGGASGRSWSCKSSARGERENSPITWRALANHGCRMHRNEQRPARLP